MGLEAWDSSPMTLLLDATVGESCLPLAGFRGVDAFSVRQLNHARQWHLRNGFYDTACAGQSRGGLSLAHKAPPQTLQNHLSSPQPQRRGGSELPHWNRVLLPLPGYVSLDRGVLRTKDT